MQKWDAQQYAKNVRFVSELGGAVVELLAPQARERILDLGCGDGPLAAELVRLGCEVVAVDSSAEMVAAARGLGLDARVVDGQDLPFENEFDAVFSNAALHWMRRPEAVVAGVCRALKPGGRFVAEFGGGHNVKSVVDALSDQLAARGIDPAPHNPWYFPAPDVYRRVLEQGGFKIETLELFERPTLLPGDVVAWLETFAQSFTGAVPEGQRGAFLSDVRDVLAPKLLGEDGCWRVDYVRLRFFAVRSH